MGKKGKTIKVNIEKVKQSKPRTVQSEVKKIKVGKPVTVKTVKIETVKDHWANKKPKTKK